MTEADEKRRLEEIRADLANLPTGTTLGAQARFLLRQYDTAIRQRDELAAALLPFAATYGYQFADSGLWKKVEAALASLSMDGEQLTAVARQRDELAAALRGLYHIAPRPWMPGSEVTYAEWEAAYAAADAALAFLSTGKEPTND